MSTRFAAFLKTILIVIILSTVLIASVLPAFAVHNRLRQRPYGYYSGNSSSWARNK